MNEWISVEDRLPERYKSCIVCSEHGNIRIGYYNSTDEWIESRYNGDLIKYITHWMPLPAPPEEKKSQDKLTLVDNNKMLWLDKENFRCSCGGNVFSEYKDSDGKRVFECHSCKSKYEGE